MPCSIVLSLTAIRDCRYDHFTGRGAHGFWLKSWTRINPAIGNWLHGQGAEDERDLLDARPKSAGLKPYTVSPLLDLPAARGGVREIAGGSPASLRITALDPRLTDALLDSPASWLANLPERITIDGAEWQIAGVATTPEQHPWAGQCSYEDLRRAALDNSTPPRRWTVEFATPTCIQGARVGGQNTALLFPIPDRVLESWRNGWNAFAPFELGEELTQSAAQNLRVSYYQLRTLTEKNRYQGNGGSEASFTGYVGEARFEAYGPEVERTYFDLLFRFAFFRGTGFHTTQGLGQTGLVESR